MHTIGLNFPPRDVFLRRVPSPSIIIAGLSKQSVTQSILTEHTSSLGVLFMGMFLYLLVQVSNRVSILLAMLSPNPSQCVGLIPRVDY